MVSSCTRSEEQPTLKFCWKWLKQLMEEYINLKKNTLNDN